MKRALPARVIRTLSLLLCTALLLALLSGCAVSGVTGRELAAAALGPAAISIALGSAPPAASQLVTMPLAQLSTVQQTQLLERYRSLWAFSSAEASSWFYAYTDLNRNGRLEVLAVSTQGTSSYTTVKCYEVSPGFNGVTECWVQSDSAGWPEITLPSLPCYFDSRTGVCYYVCEDMTKLSATEYSYTLRVFWFFDGVLQLNTLASRSVVYGQTARPTVQYRDWAGNSLSESEYVTYADRYYAALSKSSYALSWQQGSAYPAQPAVTAAPVVTPIPTPQPTPVPTPAGTVGAKVVITKNPTSESLSIGGTTWFIAHASNASAVTWQAVSPDGRTYTAGEALSLHPGLKLSGVNDDTLTIQNIPLSLNGWGFQARFDGAGNSAVSTAAYVYVGDYVTAYQSVLNAYRDAYQYGGHTAEYARQNGLSEVIAHSPHVGYAFKDLNKDGTPELFIGGVNPDAFARLIVYDVYTLVNGVPVRLAVSTDNDRFYLRSDSTLLNGGSEGKRYEHYFLFRFVGDHLESSEGYMYYKVGSDQDGCYYQKGAYSREPRPGDTKVSRTTMDSKVQAYQDAVFSLLMTQLA